MSDPWQSALNFLFRVWGFFWIYLKWKMEPHIFSAPLKLVVKNGGVWPPGASSVIALRRYFDHHETKLKPRLEQSLA